MRTWGGGAGLFCSTQTPSEKSCCKQAVFNDKQHAAAKRANPSGRSCEAQGEEKAEDAEDATPANPTTATNSPGLKSAQWRSQLMAQRFLLLGSLGPSTFFALSSLCSWDRSLLCC